MTDFRKVVRILNWVDKKRYKIITEELLNCSNTRKANTKTLQIQQSTNKKCLDLLHLLYLSNVMMDTGCRETVEE